MARITKVELGREMVRRKIIGSASIFTGSSLKWDAVEGKWTGKIDYGPEGLGRFTREQMVKSLAAGRVVLS